MAKRDHTDTLQTVLHGEGLNIPDGQIYAGMLHEGMPDACITMTETGGPQPADMMGMVESVQRPRVQVRIRHTDKADAKSDANDVWQLLHDWDGGADYSRPTMVQSSPLPIGTDGDGRYEWAVNAELFI